MTNWNCLCNYQTEINQNFYFGKSCALGKGIKLKFSMLTHFWEKKANPSNDESSWICLLVNSQQWNFMFEFVKFVGFAKEFYKILVAWLESFERMNFQSGVCWIACCVPLTARTVWELMPIWSESIWRTACSARPKLFSLPLQIPTILDGPRSLVINLQTPALTKFKTETDLDDFKFIYPERIKDLSIVSLTASIWTAYTSSPISSIWTANAWSHCQETTFSSSIRCSKCCPSRTCIDSC